LLWVQGLAPERGGKQATEKKARRKRGGNWGKSGERSGKSGGSPHLKN